jgi:ATPase subunit of ABC transporter with duplicated ATPase domains
MDELITRIVEIERQSAANVRLAESQYAERIDALRRSLEEEMNRERERILSEANSRFTTAVEEARKQADADTASMKNSSERIFQNPVLIEEIKEAIISILLAEGPV